MNKVPKVIFPAMAMILLGLVCNSWTMVQWYTPLTYTTIEYKAIILLLDISFILTGILLMIWRNKPHQLKKILTLWCSLIIALLILELGCRLYLFGWKCLSFKHMDSVYSAQSPSQPDIYQRSKVKDILVELKPHKDTYFHLARFQTNSQGLRDREYALAIPEHTFRVAVVGDSVTMGWGVEFEDIYVERMEMRARADFTDKTCEFINFAVSGYGFRQYLAVIKEKILPYYPDLILIGCIHNDDIVYPEEVFTHPRPLGPKAHPILRMFFLDMIKTNRLYRDLATSGQPIDTSTLRIRRDFSDKIFQEFKNLERQTQIPFVIAYLYTPGFHNETPRELSDKYQFHFIDTSGMFDPDKYLDYVIYPTDAHPSALSHQYYAEKIYDYLIRENLFNRPRPKDH